MASERWPVIGGVTLRSLWLLVALGLAVLVAPWARAQSPEQIFANDASGMVRVKARCATGPQEGSGFLLGPRLMMTARHVLVDGKKGRSCSARVVQEGTGVTSTVVRWTAIRVKRDAAPTDLALAVLSKPLNGYEFSISPSPPKPNQRVIALGYALGQPLSLNQGHVSELRLYHGVRLLVMSLLEAPGASGGPILDAAGRVVAVDQYGGGGFEWAVDLARVLRGHPSQLCVGVAVGQAGTTCSGPHASSLLEADGPPAVCADGFVSALPFQGCPKVPAAPPAPKVPPLALGLLTVQAHCPKVGAWQSTGFLLGARLMMTYRSALVDPHTGQPCSVHVVQDATSKEVRVTRWIGIQRADAHVSTDLALAVLASPVKGHYFSLSARSPAPGQMLHRLDFANEVPSQRNRSRVVKWVTSSGIRQLVIREPPVVGSGGGPIVDSADRVVGLVQSIGDKAHLDYSVDLAHLADGNPHEFCSLVPHFTATICPVPVLTAEHPLYLFSHAPPPKVCGGWAEVMPFTYCGADVTEAPQLAPLSTSAAAPALTRCWVTTTASFDPSQRVSTVSDGEPSVYLVYSYNRLVVGTNISITVTQPDGITRIIWNGFDWIANPASTHFRYGPFTLSRTNPAADGTWTIQASITNTKSAHRRCSTTITTASSP